MCDSPDRLLLCNDNLSCPLAIVMAEYIPLVPLFVSAGVALESAISEFLRAHALINELKRDCEHATTVLGILRSKIDLYHSTLSGHEKIALSEAFDEFRKQCDEYDGIINNLLKELAKFRFDEQESRAPSLHSVARRVTWKVARSKHRLREFKHQLQASRTRIDDIFRPLTKDHNHGRRRSSIPDTRKECQQELFKAISDGDTGLVQRLLDNGANATDTCSFIDRDEHETAKSPLHKAAELGRLGIVKLLRNHGAKLDALDSGHATPLILAIKNEQLDMAKYLIDAHIAEQRADPPLDVIRSINLTDSLGNHALAYLIKLRLERPSETSDWNEVLKSLVELKANPVTKADFSCSPLHSCAANNLVEELELLLNAPCSLEARGQWLDTAVRLKYRGDILKATPLWLAARNGDLASVKILSEHGADHTLICNGSSTLPTPLWAAYAAGSLETFTYLLGKPGTNPNVKNAKGLGILHALVLQYSNKPAQFARWLGPLFAHPDTDPNIRHSSDETTDEQLTGQSPLHWATRKAKLPIVQLLLHTPRCRDKTASISADLTQEDASDSNALRSQNKHTLINIDIHGLDKEAEVPKSQDIHASINIDILNTQYGDINTPSSSQNTTTPSPEPLPIPIDINAPDSEGKTPLMTSISLYISHRPHALSPFSSASPHHVITTYLLQQGALITPVDVNGYDAFFWACTVGDILSAASLLAQPARDSHLQLNRQTEAKGVTPLHVAAKAGKVDMVRWLLAMGADKRLECSKPFEGCSVVGTASEVAGEGGRNEEIVQVIERF